MFAVLALAAVIFRSDVFVLIGPIALVTVVTKQISIFKGAIVGIFFMVLGVALSVLVDSFYWGRIVWPEGEVFYFNTILNKSSEWGVRFILTI
jgi:alpha-1,6-mannosyltransferase